MKFESLIMSMAWDRLSKNARRNRLIMIARGILTALGRIDGTYYMTLRALTPRQTFALVMAIDAQMESESEYAVINALKAMRPDYVTDN